MTNSELMKEVKRLGKLITDEQEHRLPPYFGLLSLADMVDYLTNLTKDNK